MRHIAKMETFKVSEVSQGAKMLASKPNNLISIPEPHILEENQLHMLFSMQAAWHTGPQIHTYAHK